MKFCRDCENVFRNELETCQACGSTNIGDVLFCQLCGTANEKGARYCRSCGEQMNGPVPQPQIVPQKRLADKVRENEVVQAIKSDFENSQTIETLKKKTKKTEGNTLVKKHSPVRMVAIISAIVLVAGIAIILLSGKQWTCDRCGKTWIGDAYYAGSYSDTLCDECAAEYWSPLPYKNYKK